MTSAPARGTSSSAWTYTAVVEIRKCRSIRCTVSCSYLEGCECMCLDCICDNWGDDGESWSSGPSLVELDAYGDFAPERKCWLQLSVGSDLTTERIIEEEGGGVSEPDGGCGCPFDYPYTCPACGHSRITNHCPHDGVQNPCPACGWTDPGKRTPLQHLGLKEIPGE